MNKQKLGVYLTWAGYAAGVVTVYMVIHNPKVLIPAAVAGVLIFVGRLLEKSPAVTEQQGT